MTVLWTRKIVPELDDSKAQAVLNIQVEIPSTAQVFTNMTTEASKQRVRKIARLPPHPPLHGPHQRSDSTQTQRQKAIVESQPLLSQSSSCAMPSPEVHHLFHHPIADHSFSADRQTLAVARDNNVELYKRSGSGFTLQDELKGHDKTVTSVDIAPSTGRIVTCSQGIFTS